jgi:hypothetical protein
MVDFVPLPIVATAPQASGSSQPTEASNAPQAPARAYFVARCPISRLIDLDLIAGSGPPVPGTIYERDYFLCGPFEGAIQAVWVGASEPAEQADFQIGLVDEVGGEIAPLTSVPRLPDKAAVLIDLAGQTAGRSVYLRVKTQAQSVLLYVTLDVTLDEVM